MTDIDDDNVIGVERPMPAPKMAKSVATSEQTPFSFTTLTHNAPPTDIRPERVFARPSLASRPLHLPPKRWLHIGKAGIDTKSIVALTVSCVSGTPDSCQLQCTINTGGQITLLHQVKQCTAETIVALFVEFQNGVISVDDFEMKSQEALYDGEQDKVQVHFK